MHDNMWLPETYITHLVAVTDDEDQPFDSK